MNTQTEFTQQDLGELLLVYKNEVWGDVSFDFLGPEIKKEILRDCQNARKIFEQTFGKVNNEMSDAGLSK